MHLLESWLLMHALPLVVAQSFIYHELIVVFEMSLTSLLNYMEIIEGGYIQRNTYHDSIHAADVTQGVHVRSLLVYGAIKSLGLEITVMTK